ncbi:MAG: Uncharacterised protein [Flavobacteriaceae bacterium]|nr:MAG: Uncharacterised protein [Flavobacteriaceae bacterium]
MKKALIICYYWPPAGGPGVQRWLKFVSHLSSFDISPVVYVPENPNYPIVDKNLIEEIPPNITILKQPIKEPYKLASIFSKRKVQQISSGVIASKKPSFLEKLLLYVRGNYFIPDARVGWVAPSVDFLTHYLKTNDVDCIISSGPPHSLHLIGLKLHRLTNLPWIADFRDPWTTIHYHKSLQLTKASATQHKDLEALVLNTATHVLVTSPSTKKEFSSLTKKPITVITNGFEPKQTPIVPLDTKFSIAHIGSLLSKRNPRVLWEVLSELVKEDPIFSQDLEISLTGVVSDEVRKSIGSFGLTNHALINSYVPHKEAVMLQHKAQILLLLEVDSVATKAIIPGKLFEYLQARRPIIAIGPKGSDIQGIIDTTASGIFIAPHQKDFLKEQVLSYYSAYKKNELYIESKNLEAFTRKALTKKLAKVIVSVTESR